MDERIKDDKIIDSNLCSSEYSWSLEREPDFYRFICVLFDMFSGMFNFRIIKIYVLNKR